MHRGAAHRRLAARHAATVLKVALPAATELGDPQPAAFETAPQNRAPALR